MPDLIMLVGIPASGKSSYARQNYKDYKIYSSDELREKLFNDVNDQAHNDELFRYIHKNIIKDLKDGNNVVYDATNIYSRNRRKFLSKLSNVDCNKICVVFNVDIDKCKLRNSTRERKVPEEVIDKMYNKIETPSIDEGFDEIYYVNM